MCNDPTALFSVQALWFSVLLGCPVALNLISVKQREEYPFPPSNLDPQLPIPNQTKTHGRQERATMRSPPQQIPHLTSMFQSLILSSTKPHYRVFSKEQREWQPESPEAIPVSNPLPPGTVTLLIFSVWSPEQGHWATDCALGRGIRVPT